MASNKHLLNKKPSATAVMLGKALKNKAKGLDLGMGTIDYSTGEISIDIEAHGMPLGDEDSDWNAWFTSPKKPGKSTAVVHAVQDALMKNNPELGYGDSLEMAHSMVKKASKVTYTGDSVNMEFDEPPQPGDFFAFAAQNNLDQLKAMTVKKNTPTPSPVYKLKKPLVKAHQPVPYNWPSKPNMNTAGAHEVLEDVVGTESSKHTKLKKYSYPQPADELGYYAGPGPSEKSWKRITEVCMEGIPMPPYFDLPNPPEGVQPEHVYWDHMDAEPIYYPVPHSWSLMCPHCKRKWEIPADVVHEYAKTLPKTVVVASDGIVGTTKAIGPSTSMADAVRIMVHEEYHGFTDGPT